MDITGRYLALGDIPDLVGISAENDARIVEAIRNLLIDSGGGIPKISQLGKAKATQARYLYQENLIAAFDGTDAVSPLRFVSDTLYASGVVAVTPRSEDQPRVRVTRTKASSYVAAEGFDDSWERNIEAWGQYLRGARDQEISWISTFREYEERELALKWVAESDDRIALIDGPVLTQNLLSQDVARSLLDDLVATGQVIGFIKDLSANPLLVAIGTALQAGEAFVLEHWSSLLSERFRHGQDVIASWVADQASDVVRAIYKKDRRAYGIECTKDRIPLALAILEHDPGGSDAHDIPMLLQIADTHVRSRFRGAAARSEVLARYSIDNPREFLSLADERILR